MMEEPHIISLFLPLNQHLRQIKLNLHNRIANRYKNRKDKAKKALHRMRVIDVVMDLPRSNRGMVILRTVQIDCELLVGVVFVLVCELCAVCA